MQFGTRSDFPSLGPFLLSCIIVLLSNPLFLYVVKPRHRKDNGPMWQWWRVDPRATGLQAAQLRARGSFSMGMWVPNTEGTSEESSILWNQETWAKSQDTWNLVLSLSLPQCNLLDKSPPLSALCPSVWWCVWTRCTSLHPLKDSESLRTQLRGSRKRPKLGVRGPRLQAWLCNLQLKDAGPLFSVYLCNLTHLGLDFFLSSLPIFILWSPGEAWFWRDV